MLLAAGTLAGEVAYSLGLRSTELVVAVVVWGVTVGTGAAIGRRVSRGAAAPLSGFPLGLPPRVVSRLRAARSQVLLGNLVALLALVLVPIWTIRPDAILLGAMLASISSSARLLLALSLLCRARLAVPELRRALLL